MGARTAISSVCSRAMHSLYVTKGIADRMLFPGPVLLSRLIVETTETIHSRRTGLEGAFWCNVIEVIIKKVGTDRQLFGGWPREQVVHAYMLSVLNNLHGGTRERDVQTEVVL